MMGGAPPGRFSEKKTKNTFWQVMVHRMVDALKRELK
jgi:hypothetical protein